MGGLFSKKSRSSSRRRGSSSDRVKSMKEKADSMQEVFPNIYMGAASAAEDHSALKEMGITHVLAIGWDLKMNFIGDFDYLLLNRVEDRPGYFLIQHFAVCFDFIDTCLKGTPLPDVLLSCASASDLDEKSDDVADDVADKSAHLLPEMARDVTAQHTMEVSLRSDTGAAEAARPKGGKLLVHCHKGLSRSASIIIAYMMREESATFREMLARMRESRSFVMPNIGFQAQLLEFERLEYSVDMADYSSFSISSHISDLIPDMLRQIKGFLADFEGGRGDSVDSSALFEMTMYFHQLDMLDRSGRLRKEDDRRVLEEAIVALRRIQVEFVKVDSSIEMFHNLFKLDKTTGERVFSEKEKRKMSAAEAKLEKRVTLKMI